MGAGGRIGVGRPLLWDTTRVSEAPSLALTAGPIKSEACRAPPRGESATTAGLHRRLGVGSALCSPLRHTDPRGAGRQPDESPSFPHPCSWSVAKRGGQGEAEVLGLSLGGCVVLLSSLWAGARPVRAREGELGSGPWGGAQHTVRGRTPGGLGKQERMGAGGIGEQARPWEGRGGSESWAGAHQGPTDPVLPPPPPPRARCLVGGRGSVLADVTAPPHTAAPAPPLLML